MRSQGFRQWYCTNTIMYSPNFKFTGAVIVAPGRLSQKCSLFTASLANFSHFIGQKFNGNVLETIH